MAPTEYLKFRAAAWDAFKDGTYEVMFTFVTEKAGLLWMEDLIAVEEGKNQVTKWETAKKTVWTYCLSGTSYPPNLTDREFTRRFYDSCKGADTDAAHGQLLGAAHDALLADDVKLKDFISKDAGKAAAADIQYKNEKERAKQLGVLQENIRKWKSQYVRPRLVAKAESLLTASTGEIISFNSVIPEEFYKQSLGGSRSTSWDINNYLTIAFWSDSYIRPHYFEREGWNDEEIVEDPASLVIKDSTWLVLDPLAPQEGKTCLSFRYGDSSKGEAWMTALPASKMSVQNKDVASIPTPQVALRFGDTFEFKKAATWCLVHNLAGYYLESVARAGQYLTASGTLELATDPNRGGFFSMTPRDPNPVPLSKNHISYLLDENVRNKLKKGPIKEQVWKYTDSTKKVRAVIVTDFTGGRLVWQRGEDPHYIPLEETEAWEQQARKAMQEGKPIPFK